ncbi:MAG: NAD(P)/FAD-dependent oxidoreductase [Verrucomicrobia bacterium]|nr:NAD(P)/FAD-dependent oxidoreductase [Verrucomicrobiota bacterium]
MRHYELAVIGSGSGGREAALLGARKGLRTVVIERDRIGGSCFHRGCYAVRSLQACSRQFRDSWKSGRFGNRRDLQKATLDGWMTIQRQVSLRLVDQFQEKLQRFGVDLIQGHGSLLDDRTLQVIDAQGHKSTLTGENIIVATGSRPDFDDRSYLRAVNSDRLLTLNVLPHHFAIIGAGYIGCEFASIYRRLGAEVTLIERLDRVLPGWEPEAGNHVAESLTTRGVKILLNFDAGLNDLAEHETAVRVRSRDGQAVEAEMVLVATGRKPNSQGLGLHALGIDDASALAVDSSMRLSRPGLYAVGDVTGLGFLDSTAYSQANVAINAILGKESRLDHRGIPRCIHTEPAIATVGCTESEAAGSGVEFAVASTSMRLVSDDDRSLVDPEPTVVKIIINPQSRTLLGCLVIGDHAAVIANVAAIAIHSKMPIEQLREIPMAQPSAADALINTLRALD